MQSSAELAAGRGTKRRSSGDAYTLLLVTSAVLVGTGLVMVLSASSVQAFRQHGSPFLYFFRQIFGLAAGIAAMLVLSKVDYRKLRVLARPFFWLCAGLLVLVLVPSMSATRGGSSRWLELGPLTFQPSEPAKLAVILFCAHILERKGTAVGDAREMALPMIPAVGLVGLLVVLQPDLGTAIICVGCAFIVAHLAGARAGHLVVAFSASALAAGALALSEGYRRARLFSFLDPWADPLDSGYQIIQSQIAMGSGGLFGVGLGASRQKWSYVPNAHTDFLYAILGEELGLVGSLSILALFAFFIYLGVRIAKKAPDRFGLLLAGGITGWIGLQTLINMGAVSGLLPITGVPLPLMSFGGSSLVFTMAGLGILLSVARRGRA